MKVYKFGGASINTVERIKNVAKIIDAADSNLFIIISAMGKTTNALEKVVTAFYAGQQDEALQLFEVVKKEHLSTAKNLLEKNYLECKKKMSDFFTEAEWLLYDKPVREYDYYYDQIVCLGEMLSTVMVSHYLTEINMANTWLDVRDLIRTDNNFRDANIDWEITAKLVETAVGNGHLTPKKTILITQGFVGATDENESTTLGREGSDFSAAIFANLLNAESMTIWKDVESVMNADPKNFPEAVAIPKLSYAEVIEMAYYGAQVIHPKTIKPLFQKSIPLFVKCFLNAALPGTEILNQSVKNLPPIFVKKSDQVLLHFRSKDYSFMGEKPLAKLYQLFAEMSIRPSLTQNGAISFLCCLDDREDKIQKLAVATANLFDLQIEKGLELLTVRHYSPEVVAKLTKGKDIILEQKDKEMVQVLMR